MLRERQLLAEQKVKARRRQEREARRRERKRRLQEQRLGEEEQDEEFARKIAVEERKLLEAQRKLESIRLLDELFERVKVKKVEVVLITCAAAATSRRCQTRGG